jgi:hypothetical protein
VEVAKDLQDRRLVDRLGFRDEALESAGGWVERVVDLVLPEREVDLVD